MGGVEAASGLDAITMYCSPSASVAAGLPVVVGGITMLT